MNAHAVSRRYKTDNRCNPAVLMQHQSFVTIVQRDAVERQTYGPCTQLADAIAYIHMAFHCITSLDLCFNFVSSVLYSPIHAKSVGYSKVL